MNTWLERFKNHPNYHTWQIKEITLSDQELYNENIQKTEYPVNTWSSNFTYLWAHTNSNKLNIFHAWIDDFLVTIILTNTGRLYLPCLPFGEGNVGKILDVLIKCAKFCSKWNKESDYIHKSIVNPVNEVQLEFLKQSPRYHELFNEESLTGLERHYSIPLLLELKGKDFSSIRNKLNYFRKNYENANIRHYQKSDYDEVMKLEKQWTQKSGQKYNRIIDGFYFEPIIKHYSALNHIILIMEYNNQIIGLSTGEILPTGEAWGCMTKFDNEYRGLSETLAIEMVKEIHRINPRVETMNVGSDLGKKGLAFFKDRFRPVLNYKRYALFDNAFKNY